MPAVLRAVGSAFDVDAFLTGCTLPVCTSYRVGEPLLPRTKPGGRRRETAGVHIEVSDAGFDDFGRQVTDAVTFLGTHTRQLRRLVTFPGVEGVSLDFGTARRDVAVQCDRLPAELVALCGRYRMGIELSHYPADA